MRDLRIFRIFEGTNDILRLMIALQSIQVLGKMIAANKMMAVKSQISATTGFNMCGNAGGKLSSLADGYGLQFCSRFLQFFFWKLEIEVFFSIKCKLGMKAINFKYLQLLFKYSINIFKIETR